MNRSTEVDEFIAGFPMEVQQILEKLRDTIQKTAPEAQETINYGIPTFTLEGNLVHFAAYKGHIGFYPGPSALQAFKEELAGYKGAKGSVQFPLNKPLPWETIVKMVQFRVEENRAKAIAKSLKKSKK